MTLFSRTKVFNTNIAITRTLATRYLFPNLWTPNPSKVPKEVSAAEAVKCVKSGDVIYVNATAATPTVLLDALCGRVDQDDLSNISLDHVILGGPATWAQEKYWGKIRSNCLFISTQLRAAVHRGQADYTPIFLSDTHRPYTEGIRPVDISFISVSPPDINGNCTLGADVLNAPQMIEKSKIVIALVNPNVPRTFGHSQLHVSHIDYLVKASTGLYGFPDNGSGIDEREAEMGRLIAENLIEDGTTLQLGVGGSPTAVLNNCHNHKDLGVHSELISDNVAIMMENGVITNRRKSFMPGKTVATIAIGSEEFYKKLDNNPNFYFGVSAFTNNIQVIRSNSKLTSINGALEVDITGQVVSDSIGSRPFSGRRSCYYPRSRSIRRY